MKGNPLKPILGCLICTGRVTGLGLRIQFLTR